MWFGKGESGGGKLSSWLVGQGRSGHWGDGASGWGKVATGAAAHGLGTGGTRRYASATASASSMICHYCRGRACQLRVFFGIMWWLRMSGSACCDTA